MTITCPHCRASFDAEGIIAREAETLARQQMEKEYADKLAAARSEARKNFEREFEREREQIRKDLLAEHETGNARQLAELKALKQRQTEDKAELDKLLSELLQANKDKEKAETEARKKLILERDTIRKEAKAEAAEAGRLRLLELEKQLSDTKTALETAKQKAEQGSMQTQGEVLELDIEARLKAAFPADEIAEVRKGAFGADVLQYIEKNIRADEAGLIVWECKNAKWNGEWLSKLKSDTADKHGDAGILVSVNMPESYGDFFQTAGNIYVVKPKLAETVAALIRGAVIDVARANEGQKNSADKAVQLYNYMTGNDFRGRINNIVDYIRTMKEDIDKQRKSMTRFFNKQEEALRLTAEQFVGMYGKFEAIGQQEFPQLPILDNE